MMQVFSFWPRLLLPVLLLAAAPAWAQLNVRPLGADPDRARYAPTATAAQARTTVVSLPFFDDFTTPLEGAPRSDRWLPGGGTLVTNRFALTPLSRGAVTFDGLKADGTAYTGITSSTSATDTLTSQPINLSNLTVNDSVYLSFAWQLGSIIGVPATSSSSNAVNLDLQFRSSTGRWTSATGWPQRRTTQTQPTAFRQVVLSLNEVQYLYGSFQFRFIATGRTYFVGDTWSVDYVRLDRGRGRHVTGGALADTVMTDVATSAGFDTLRSAGLSNPLLHYTALPVWQFNAAPTAELNPRMGVHVLNLNAPPLPLPVPWNGTVRELNSNAQLGSWGSGVVNLTTLPSRINQLEGSAAAVSIPTTAGAKRLRFTLALGSRETTPQTLPNDTIYRDVVLDNYYAHDDGTAEGTVYMNPLPAGLPSYFAYRFVANQADQVQALRLYPRFTAADASARSVTINVWDSDHGKPAATARVSKAFSIPNPLPNGASYIDLTFDTPVSVADTFYVGYGQPAQNRILEYGYDMNSLAPPNTFWVSQFGAWAPVTTLRPTGALMMRAIMNNNILATAAPTLREAGFTLYPNPSTGTVQVEGPAFGRATVLDALGRTAWEQPVAQAGQPQLDLGPLAPGVYIVRLALADGRVATRRLVISR